jgi:hypothetical protein
MFSPREELILKVLGKKKLTLREIVTEMFADKPREKPFDAEISIGNSIRRIIEKCEFHKIEWTLSRERKGNKHLYFKVKV